MSEIIKRNTFQLFTIFTLKLKVMNTTFELSMLLRYVQKKKLFAA